MGDGPEVIRRRRRRLLQLCSLYRAQLWALADELSARHAEYWWEHGASPIVAPGAGNAVGDGGAPLPLPLPPAVNGGVRAGSAAGRAGCLAANCGAKAMPLTSYCFDHILSDPKQRLYKPCAFVTKRSGMQSDVTTCGKPALTGITPLRCSEHDPKSQRLFINALKKVGIDLPLTSKSVPKLSLLICESVRQIQMKRRMQLNGAKNVPLHRSSK
uniref:KAT8 regulatory NSL complex subunit 2 n=1 Tax=Oryza brachyantha TaxID=4533 RepID=J3NCB1_ORYBR